MIGGLRLALSLLTIVPVGTVTPTRREARAAMLWAPFVALVVGFAAALVVGAVRVNAPGHLTFAAVFGIATTAVLTRGLHLDGLADTADGLGSLRAPGDAVEVMKRGDVGPFGVVALVLVLLVQVAALGVAVTEGRGTCALLVASMTGRLAATLSCTPRTPAVGGGLGSLVAGAVPRAAAFGVTGVVLAAAFGLGWMDEGVGLNSALHSLGAAVLGLAAAHALRAHCVRRLGGVNGDVLGAQVEAAATVVLVVFAMETWR